MKYKVPYILKLKKGKRELIYFGSKHSKNPSAAQFKKIEKLFTIFRKANIKSNAVILIENFLPKLEKSKSTMIKKYGESGLLQYFAHRYGIPSMCPEPTHFDLTKLLIAGYKFKKSDVAEWIFLNILVNTHRDKLNFANKNLLKPLLKTCVFIEKITGLKRIRAVSGASSEGYISKIDKYYTRQINKRFKNVLPNSIALFSKQKIQLKKLKKIQNPFIKGGVYNDIACAANNIRDRFIAKAIINELQSGKSVFTVFGANHAFAQKPALKTYFSKLKSDLHKERGSLLITGEKTS